MRLLTILAAIALLLASTPRSVQPVTTPVPSWQEVAPATAGLTGVPTQQDPLRGLVVPARPVSGGTGVGAPSPRATVALWSPKPDAVGSTPTAVATLRRNVHAEPSITEMRHVSPPPGVVSGIASTYGPAFSEWWVAIPQGPGWNVRVCGAGGCRTLRSTDAGPDLAEQRAGRIIDLPVGAFAAVCGEPWTVGLCRVTTEVWR